MQWKNVTLTLLVLLLSVNGAFLYMTTGDPSLSDVIGVEINLDQSPFGTSNAAARSIDAVPSGSVGFALGNAALMLTSTLTVIWNLIFSAPKIMLQLGVSPAITAFIFTPLYLLTGLTIIHMITGRG
tara:strand:- start:1968 stop:2348 length:381 start_codon:yes stop_codon:yes gene_type:complete